MDDGAGDWRDQLERLHPVLTVTCLVALVSWPFVGRRWGLGVAASCVIGAGLIPIITGEYRTRMAYLDGARARMRGLVSVAIGGLFLGLALW